MHALKLTKTAPLTDLLESTEAHRAHEWGFVMFDVCVCPMCVCAVYRLCCAWQGIEVVVTLHRWWECFFIYFSGECEEMRRRGAEEKGKERLGGGLHLWCCNATVMRAAVIGLHIEGFRGAAGWANSQLDLSDGIQSSSLPSLLCSSFPLSRLLLWHVCFFLFPSSPCPSTHLHFLCFIPHRLTLNSLFS